MTNKEKTIGILGGGQLGMMLAIAAKNLGFKSAACGPLVRSSYHAEKQIFETAI